MDENTHEAKKEGVFKRVLNSFLEKNIISQITHLITILGFLKVLCDFCIDQTYKQNANIFYKMPTEYFAIDSNKNLFLTLLYLILLAFIGSPILVKKLYPTEDNNIITKIANGILWIVSFIILWRLDIGALKYLCSQPNTPRWIYSIINKGAWVILVIVVIFYLIAFSLYNIGLRPKKVWLFVFLISASILIGISVVYFISANEFIIKPSHKVYYETFIDPEYGNMAVISKISDQTKLIAVNYEIKDDSPNILYTSKYIVLPTEGKFFKRKKIGPNPEIK